MRSSRPTQIHLRKKIRSISSARMSGEVKYSRGRVCAPSIGISVGLMKVVTARLELKDHEICRGRQIGGSGRTPPGGPEHARLVMEMVAVMLGWAYNPGVRLPSPFRLGGRIMRRYLSLALAAAMLSTGCVEAAAGGAAAGGSRILRSTGAWGEGLGAGYT